jgi:2-dehydropantoate 2-reductase
MIGAGAIGGTLGALMVAGGESLRFIDSDQEHVDAIRKHGLRIETVSTTLVVDVPADTWEEFEGPISDTALIAVKGQYTRDVLRRMEALNVPRSVVSLQNGLSSRLIAQHLGSDRSVPTLPNLFADCISPGVIKYYEPGELFIGRTRDHRRDSDIREMFRHWGSPVYTENIEGFQWSKLGYFAMTAAGALVDDPGVAVVDAERDLMIALMAETYEVAVAEGVTLEPFSYLNPYDILEAAKRGDDADWGCLDRYVERFRAVGKTKSGVWRDLAVRQRETEIDATVGQALDIGQEHGLDLPLTRKLVTMIHELEGRKRSMGWDNVEELKQMSCLHRRSL